ncbi:ufm1-specific protease 2-like isoform X2 [Glandiceps talaboti]
MTTAGDSVQSKMNYMYVMNVHENLLPPNDLHTVSMGWGCAYRTLQTICSWIRHQDVKHSKLQQEPTLQEIQEALVAMGDKSASFIGSKDWIGSVELGLCVDYFHDVPCKIIHIKSGDEISSKIPELLQHFQSIGAPIMMGGNSDSSSKGILGVAQSPSQSYLLVLDPHFHGNPNIPSLQESGWVKWRTIDSFMTDSFYNFCLPQYKR